MGPLAAILGFSALSWALYTVLSPRNNYRLWRPLIFHPMPFEPGTETPPELFGVQGQDVHLKLPNRIIHGWYYKLPGATKTILFSHGNSGNLSYRAALTQLMLQAGSSVFVYDYAGFGDSTGVPSLEGIVEDGVAGYKWLIEQGVTPSSIVLYGESLGAAVAMQLSAIVECCCIVIQSGFSSLRTIAKEIYPIVRIYPPRYFPVQSLDTIALLRKAHRPLLIIHGRLDQVVPFSHGEEMYAAAVGVKQFLRLNETAHSDIVSTAADKYVKTLREFLLTDHAATDLAETDLLTTQSPN